MKTSDARFHKRVWMLVIPALMVATICGGDEQPVNPGQLPSSVPKPKDDGPHAHTNFELEAIGQQAVQEMVIADPLESITVDSHTIKGLQILNLPSGQIGSTADVFARYALATGQPAPNGAEITAHTNFKIAGKGAARSPIPIPAIGAVVNNIPSEIIARYGLAPTAPVDKGLIVIVDAYDDPTAEADLARFNSQYHLPSCSSANGCLTIKKVDPARTLPDTDPRVDPQNCGWSVETSLDLQWVHAIAPNAKLVLVEATTSSANDLFAAIETANNIAEGQGGGVVSLSWSFEETVDETKYDIHFQHNKILYFAASGDQGGVVEYPASSPFVISVGGTKVTRDNADKVLSEVAWENTGGGYSVPEMRPSFQNSPTLHLEGTTGRVVPDIAGPAGIDLQLVNGSPIFVGTICSPNVGGWYAAGGTSIATPIVAAAASIAFPSGGSTLHVLENIYNRGNDSSAVKDITFGRAGNNFAKKGYDAVTGVGVPASLQFVMPPRITPSP